MWRWKASRLTALPPPVMSSWARKTTPQTRASACQLETASAPGCLKLAFAEKVGAPPHFTPSVTKEPDPVTHQHPLPFNNSRQTTWHSSPPVSTPHKCPFSNLPHPLPRWFTFPLFEHGKFYSTHGSLINCADRVCWLLVCFMVVIEWSVITLIRQSPRALTHGSHSITDRYATVTPILCCFFMVHVVCHSLFIFSVTSQNFLYWIIKCLKIWLAFTNRFNEANARHWWISVML